MPEQPAGNRQRVCLLNQARHINDLYRNPTFDAFAPKPSEPRARALCATAAGSVPAANHHGLNGDPDHLRIVRYPFGIFLQAANPNDKARSIDQIAQAFGFLPGWLEAIPEGRLEGSGV